MNGQELKARRRVLGWSQQRLATELGVSLNAVARWEQGGRPISRVVELALERIELGEKSAA